MDIIPHGLLLDRLHNVSLADGLTLQDIDRKGGIVTHGLERLPIRFDAAARRIRHPLNELIETGSPMAVVEFEIEDHIARLTINRPKARMP